MRFFEVPLREDKPGVRLRCYIGDLENPIRDAVLICPGGGYECVCADREGDAVALPYVAKGINAFVLIYSICSKFPEPMVDASLAMLYIRRHAAEFFINPDRVFICRFSAGGHLSASMGTLWHMPELKQRIPDMKDGENRPTGMILSYPVISGGEYTHLGSFCQILGTFEPTMEQRDLYSLEKRVDTRTCPAFLWHTADDCCVPVENTLIMAMALSRQKIPFEVHVYPSAPHGSALCNSVTADGNACWDDPAIGQWLDHSILWMKKVK